jgi:uncharacterized protein
VNTASIGAIQRALLRLEATAASVLRRAEPRAGRPDAPGPGGRGIINMLAADQLILKPRLYSSFLLWLLSELFEKLPEVGDQPLPKLVFVFDEAHLLFNDCPPALRQRVEQVVRLIRSKGVGVYFCSQNPDDVPNEILGQLGNRVQHALRAFTPRDQKAVRTAAETFVPNPELDVAQAITTLGVGEALVSMLGERGMPQPVQQALICPPRCRMGAITPESGRRSARAAPWAVATTPVDRESAYEMLARTRAGCGRAAHARGRWPRRRRRRSGTQGRRACTAPAEQPPGRRGGHGQVHRADHRQHHRPRDRARPARLTAGRQATLNDTFAPPNDKCGKD